MTGAARLEIPAVRFIEDSPEANELDLRIDEAVLESGDIGIAAVSGVDDGRKTLATLALERMDSTGTYVDLDVSGDLASAKRTLATVMGGMLDRMGTILPEGADANRTVVRVSSEWREEEESFAHTAERAAKRRGLPLAGLVKFEPAHPEYQQSVIEAAKKAAEEADKQVKIAA